MVSTSTPIVLSQQSSLTYTNWGTSACVYSYVRRDWLFQRGRGVCHVAEELFSGLFPVFKVKVNYVLLFS